MVVGESGSGKSTALNTLSKVLNRLAQQGNVSYDHNTMIIILL